MNPQDAPSPLTLGESRQVAVTDLLLDPLNPRLPHELQGMDQEDLAVHMALGFDAYTVAESIARHGYFMSEPVIAIKSDVDPSVHPGELVVVEGNRRLTALIGLVSKDVRSQFADHERWEQLAEQADLPEDLMIPVVVAPGRREVTPIIGFRHISGILQWQPYAQARYIAKLVEDEGSSFKQVAETIGIDSTKVGNLYRDQAIAQQARSLGVETGNLERSFSLLTVAMGTTKLRSHVGAPLASKTVPGEPPVPPEREDELRETLVWLFGDGPTKPVVADSREISKLGNVVATEVGLKSLRSGESLEQAIQKAKDADTDPQRRLLNRLRAGRSALRAASEDIAAHDGDEEVRNLLEEIEEAAEALRTAVDGI